MQAALSEVEEGYAEAEAVSRLFSLLTKSSGGQTLKKTRAPAAIAKNMRAVRLISRSLPRLSQLCVPRTFSASFDAMCGDETQKEVSLENFLAFATGKTAVEAAGNDISLSDVRSHAASPAEDLQKMKRKGMRRRGRHRGRKKRAHLGQSQRVLRPILCRWSNRRRFMRRRARYRGERPR